QGLLAHQALDAMQSTGHAVRENILPDAARSVGPIAADEARPNLGCQLLITSRAMAGRSCQPRIEPTTRDTERPAHPSRRRRSGVELRSTPRCFAMKPNFTGGPSRSRPRLLWNGPPLTSWCHAGPGSGGEE